MASFSLSVLRWSVLTQSADIIANAVGSSYRLHLGGNCFLETFPNSDKVHLTKYEQLYEDVVALNADEYIALTADQFHTVMARMCDIEAVIPELSLVIPCYMREDHKNQLGAAMCFECNPPGMFYD